MWIPSNAFALSKDSDKAICQTLIRAQHELAFYFNQFTTNVEPIEFEDMTKVIRRCFQSESYANITSPIPLNVQYDYLQSFVVLGTIEKFYDFLVIFYYGLQTLTDLENQECYFHAF
jgi:hypothetical protein